MSTPQEGGTTALAAIATAASVLEGDAGDGAIAQALVESVSEEPGSDQISVPPVLSCVETDNGVAWELLLHSTNCFECDGFNPGPSATRKMARQKCRTRENCPGNGQQIAVVIVGKRKACLNKIIQAQTGGPLELASVISDLVTQVRDGELDEATLIWAMEQAGLASTFAVPIASEAATSEPRAPAEFPSLSA